MLDLPKSPFLSSLVNHSIALHCFCFFSLPSQLTNKKSVFLWFKRYLLQPKGNGSKSKSDDLGSLRLKLTYIEDTVLPSACYTPLCNLLLKSPDVKVRQLQTTTVNPKTHRNYYFFFFIADLQNLCQCALKPF